MKRRKFRQNLFYIPALLLIALFVIRPFCETVYISLCKWNGYSVDKAFIGLSNYVSMFKDVRLMSAFLNTLIFGFGSTLLQNIIGLSIAIFVNTGFKGNSIVRVIVYLPIMISGLIMGYIMYFFLTYNNGVLNDILGWFGVEAVDWLASGKRGILFITLINSWQFSGNCFIIYLSGLQNVPKMYVEAAAIDGANSRQSFFYITMPMLVPAMTTAVVINLIGGFKLYDVVVSLTNGGPNYATNSLMSYMNTQYFLAEKAGYASAIGISTFALIMVVSLLANGFFEKKRIEM